MPKTWFPVGCGPAVLPHLSLPVASAPLNQDSTVATFNSNLESNISLD